MNQPRTSRRGRARAVVLVAMVGIGAVAWAVAQQFSVPAPWKAALAALAALVPLVVAELRERFKQDDDLTRTCVTELHRFSRRRGIPAVSAIRDLRELNVTPTRSPKGTMSPYVRRDRDEDLHRALDEHRFVVIVGESKAGKTRMAAEAIQLKFPHRRLIYPSGAQSLAKLLSAGLSFEDSVVWLDELQIYLGDPGLGQLLDHVSGPDQLRDVTIVGTITDKNYAEYQPQGGLDSPDWRILQRGERVFVRRRLSDPERERTAKAYDDAGLLGALERFGLAEYLAAGPDLVERLEVGYTVKPVGALIVLAVADWTRTGVTRPLPRELLAQLVPVYAQRMQIPEPTVEELDEALQWACQPIYASSALVAPRDDGLVAFDYIVEHDVADGILPAEVWNLVLSIAEGDDAIRVGLRAEAQDLPDIALHAFQVAVTKAELISAASAAFNYAVMLERLGRTAEAEEYYLKAADSRHAEAAYAAGRLLMARDADPELGERYLRQAAEQGLADAAFALGRSLLERQPEEARDWITRAADSGHVKASHTLGRMLVEGDDASLQKDGQRYLVFAAERDDHDAAFDLGIWLRERDRNESLRWLRVAATAGHREAAYAVGRMLESDDRVAEAAEFFKLAARASTTPGEAQPARPARRRRPFLLSRGTPDLQRCSDVLMPTLSLEGIMTSRTDAELRRQTAEYRQRLSRGEGTESLMPEALATFREAASRDGMETGDTQLLAAAAMCLGLVADLPAGIERDVAVGMAAYLAALPGDAVHVLHRTAERAGTAGRLTAPVFARLGMTTGTLSADREADDRQAAYRADVVYAPVAEVIFDYMRDQISLQAEDCLLPSLDVAIVDEADLTLLDEAREFYEITESSSAQWEWYPVFARLAKLMTCEIHYEVDAAAKSATLTERGIEFVEDQLGIGNLYQAESVPFLAYATTAIRAKELYVRDEHYAIREDRVVVLDAETNAEQSSKRLSNGLQQAVEAKEGLLISNELITKQKITCRDFLRLYRRLTGISTAAAADADAFRLAYGLEIVDLGSAGASQRVDRCDVVAGSADAKWRAVVELVGDRHSTGQPVLVSVTSPKDAETVRDALLANGIEADFLLARTDEAEAAGFANIAVPGRVTVAVNVHRTLCSAPLGGAAATPERAAEVAALGGLAIVGTNRELNRRLDDRLCSLAGRHGDPGDTVFVLSFDDPLLQGVPQLSQTLLRDSFVTSPLMHRAIRARQALTAATLLDLRQSAFAYDQLVEDQRRRASRFRQEVLAGRDLDRLTRGFLREQVQLSLDSYGPDATRHWTPQALASDLFELCGVRLDADALPAGSSGAQRLSRARRFRLVKKAAAANPLALSDLVHSLAEEAWNTRIRSLGSEIWFELQRRVVLTVLDRLWREQLARIDEAWDAVSIHKALGRVPLREFEKEIAHGFDTLQAELARESVGFLMNLEVEVMAADDDGGGRQQLDG